MTKKNSGKVFEASFQKSAESYGLFNDRIKDPPHGTSASKNKYDYYLYYKPNLFALELKSTQNKSVSFDESIIKQHQIDNLTKAASYDGVISGFIFNFREYDNATYFVDINEFNAYKEVAESGSKEHEYIKVNGSSIPLEVCQQKGIEIKNRKKKVNYHYDIKEFVERAINEDLENKS